ncbi:MAG: hypothetical protein WBG42_13380 [Cryomorphaceae bacterium]
MKLKVYLLGGLVAAFGLQASAQVSTQAEDGLRSFITLPQLPQDKKIDYNTNSEKNTVYTNEFDDAND